MLVVLPVAVVVFRLIGFNGKPDDDDDDDDDDDQLLIILALWLAEPLFSTAMHAEGSEARRSQRERERERERVCV